MRKVAAAYFGIVGIFIMSGLMVQTTEWTSLHHRATWGSALQVWPDAAAPSDAETAWQQHLDKLHW